MRQLPSPTAFRQPPHASHTACDSEPEPLRSTVRRNPLASRNASSGLVIVRPTIVLEQVRRAWESTPADIEHLPASTRHAQQPPPLPSLVAAKRRLLLEEPLTLPLGSLALPAWALEERATPTTPLRAAEPQPAAGLTPHAHATPAARRTGHEPSVPPPLPQTRAIIRRDSSRGDESATRADRVRVRVSDADLRARSPRAARAQWEAAPRTEPVLRDQRAAPRSLAGARARGAGDTEVIRGPRTEQAALRRWIRARSQAHAAQQRDAMQHATTRRSETLRIERPRARKSGWGLVAGFGACSMLLAYLFTYQMLALGAAEARAYPPPACGAR